MHFTSPRSTVHVRSTLQQTSHMRDAFCVRGERRCKIAFPLSSNASAPPRQPRRALLRLAGHVLLRPAVSCTAGRLALSNGVAGRAPPRAGLRRRRRAGRAEEERDEGGRPRGKERPALPQPPPERRRAGHSGRPRRRFLLARHRLPPVRLPAAVVVQVRFVADGAEGEVAVDLPGPAAVVTGGGLREAAGLVGRLAPAVHLRWVAGRGGGAGNGQRRDHWVFVRTDG